VAALAAIDVGYAILAVAILLLMMLAAYWIFEVTGDSKHPDEKRVRQDGKPMKPSKFRAKYIGGYGAFPEPKDVKLQPYPDYLEVPELGLTIPYDQLQNVQTMTEQRLKASRIFLVGIFAFAWKKRTPYLVITFTDEVGIEQNPVFDVAAISAIQPFLYQQMVNARPSEPATPQPVLQPASKEDPMEKLAKLKNMVNAGLVTEEDYNTKKAELLAKM
jgi:hypothetical protein